MASRSRSAIHVILLFAGALYSLSLAAQEARRPAPFVPGDSIEAIRQKIQANGYSFRVRDYQAETGRKYFIPGRHPSALSPSALNAFASAATHSLAVPTTLPARFDWRSNEGKSYIGPVRDQGALGSCFSFAACATAEGVYNRAMNLTDTACADFSESYIVWSLASISPYSNHFSGEGGADYEYFELLGLTVPGAGTGKEGVCSEADFPYQVTEPTQSQIDASWNFPRVKFNAWARVYPEYYADTTMQIKTAIMAFGVVDAAVNVTDAFQGYENGVYEDTQTMPDAYPYYYTTTNHAISLVGWDDAPAEGGGGCWIMRNSWGPAWGESGYMRIRYFSACVNTAAAYVIYYSGATCVISGQVTSGSAAMAGVAMAGVAMAGVAMDGLPGAVVTDASGAYRATVSSGWSGTVAPRLDNFTFTPAIRAYTDVTSDQTGQDYAGAMSSELPVLALYDGDRMIADGDTVWAGAAFLGGPETITTLTAQNFGAAPLSFKQSLAPQYSYSVTLPTTSIMPGSSATISLALQTPAKGLISIPITLVTNSPSTPMFHIMAKGVVNNSGAYRVQARKCSVAITGSANAPSLALTPDTTAPGKAGVTISAISERAADRLDDNPDKGIYILRECIAISSLTVTGSLKSLKTAVPILRLGVSRNLGILSSAKGLVADLHVAGALGRVAMSPAIDQDATLSPQIVSVFAEGTTLRGKTLVTVTGASLGRLDIPNNPTQAAVTAKKNRLGLFGGGAGAVKAGAWLSLKVTGGDITGPITAMGEIKSIVARNVGYFGGTIAMPIAYGTSWPTTMTLIASGLKPDSPKKDIGLIQAMEGMKVAVVAGVSQPAVIPGGLTRLTADKSGVLKRVATRRDNEVLMEGLYWASSGANGKAPAFSPKDIDTFFIPGGAQTLQIGGFEVIGQN